MHGNFIENAPIVALSLAGAETLEMGAVWLWIGFLSFWVGRLLHYYLYDSRQRGISMALTTFPALIWGCYILWMVWIAG